MSYKDGGYVVSSGGYYGGDGAQGVLKDAAELFIPGVAFMNRAEVSRFSWKWWLGLAVALLMILMFILPWVLGSMGKLGGGMQGYSGPIQTLGNLTPWGGAPGAAKVIKLSDPYHDAGYGTLSRAKAADSFLGGGVGPEFVEQPNYVLGQENMLRTALNNYSRLKAKGLAGNWSDYWANYQAENADDLSASLYDFGDENQGFEGTPGAGLATQAKKLRTSLMQR